LDHEYGESANDTDLFRSAVFGVKMGSFSLLNTPKTESWQKNVSETRPIRAILDGVSVLLTKVSGSQN
jgi:hypothetical protein